MNWSVWFVNQINWFITKIWLKRFIHKSDIDMSLITSHESLFLTQSYHVASEDLGYSAWVIWSFSILFDGWKQVHNTSKFLLLCYTCLEQPGNDRSLDEIHLLMFIQNDKHLCTFNALLAHFLKAADFC